MLTVEYNWMTITKFHKKFENMGITSDPVLGSNSSSILWLKRTLRWSLYVLETKVQSQFDNKRSLWENPWNTKGHHNSTWSLTKWVTKEPETVQTNNPENKTKYLSFKKICDCVISFSISSVSFNQEKEIKNTIPEQDYPPVYCQGHLHHSQTQIFSFSCQFSFPFWAFYPHPSHPSQCVVQTPWYMCPGGLVGLHHSLLEWCALATAPAILVNICVIHLFEKYVSSFPRVVWG